MSHEWINIAVALAFVGMAFWLSILPYTTWRDR